MARHLYLGLGIASFVLAMIGIVLPIMPTVPFLLVSAFCFARSNPAWEQALLDHPRYGPPLRQWRERKAISRKAKISAVLAMSAGVGFTWLTVGWPWVLISVAVLVIAGSWIWTRAE